MGKNKAFLPFAHSPTLVSYQYERLKKIFTSVYLSAKDANTFKELDALVIEDTFHQEVSAPTVGLISAFAALETEDSFFALSVDTPFVSEEIIRKCLEASDALYDAIIVRTACGIHPLCGIYTRALEEPLIEMVKNGDHKLSRLLTNANVLYIDIEDDEALMNLNTPEEYEKALERLKNTR